MGSTRDNIYIDINKRTFFLADNIDNESAGKLMWDILYLIREDKEQDKKYYAITVSQSNYILILMEVQ